MPRQGRSGYPHDEHNRPKPIGKSVDEPERAGLPNSIVWP